MKRIIPILIIGALLAVGAYYLQKNRNAKVQVHTDVTVTNPPATQPKVGQVVSYINDKFANGCKEDTDCIKVRAGACGCSEGGKARSILADQEETYTEYISKKSKEIVCPQVISNDITCSEQAVPACKENVCVLVIKK